MRTGDLSSGSGKMNFAMKSLRLAWEDTKQDWHDISRQQFEQTHLETLDRKFAQAAEAISRLQEVFNKAYEECS